MNNNLTSADSTHDTDCRTDNLYKLDGRIPPLQALFFAFQHVIAMFVGNIAPIIVVAAVAQHNGAPLSEQETTGLYRATMIAAGIATLIQVFPIWRIGARLPIVMGTDFAFLGVSVVMAEKDYSIIIGAAIASGIIVGIIGLLAPWWRRLLAPVTSACVLLVIAISLFQSGMFQLAGAKAADAGTWPHFVVGLITIMTYIVAIVKLRGIWRQLSILFALLIGYFVACIVTICGWANLVHFPSLHGTISSQGLFAIPQLFPFAPTFYWPSIVTFTVISFSAAAEITGATDAICNSCLQRNATNREIAGAVSCSGFAQSAVAALLGCLPLISFSQNVGILAITKIYNLRVIATVAGILFFAGLMPAVGSALASFPACVLGGCMVIVFGSIFTTGIQMLIRMGLTPRNTLNAAISLSMGIGASLAPNVFVRCSQEVQDCLVYNPIPLVFLISCILSFILPSSLDKETIETAELDTDINETRAPQ